MYLRITNVMLMLPVIWTGSQIMFFFVKIERFLIMGSDIFVTIKWQLQFVHTYMNPCYYFLQPNVMEMSLLPLSKLSHGTGYQTQHMLLPIFCSKRQIINTLSFKKRRRLKSYFHQNKLNRQQLCINKWNEPYDAIDCFCCETCLTKGMYCHPWDGQQHGHSWWLIHLQQWKWYMRFGEIMYVFHQAASFVKLKRNYEYLQKQSKAPY